MGVEGLEPSRPIKSTDFKSVVSTIPPYPQYNFIKATPRFELGIEDLQSTALPLGHIALKETTIHNISYILIKVKEIKRLILS